MVSVHLQQVKICEGCGRKAPTYGLPAERRRRWCSGCAAAVKGETVYLKKMCEGCGLKWPHYGLPAERLRRKARWCGGCAAAEGSGAVSLNQRRKVTKRPPGQWARAVAAAQLQMAQRDCNWPAKIEHWPAGFQRSNI